MTKNKLLAFVNCLIKEHLANEPMSDLEKMAITVQIYHIFETNDDLSILFIDLVEFLEEQDSLAYLVEKIENYFLTEK